MKNIDILNLGLVLDRFSDEKFPGKLAFKIYSLSNEVRPITDSLEKTRLNLLDQFGVKNEEKQVYEFESDANASEFQKAYAEVLDMDSKVNFVTSLSDKDLESLPNVSPSELNILIKVCR